MAEVSKHVGQRSPWNSLEIAKLAISTSITLAIFIVGYLLQAQQTHLAIEREAAGRRQAIETARYSQLLEKRIELWDRMAPQLARMNLLLNTARRTPEKLREVEQLLQRTNELQVAYQLYFSADFVTASEEFADIVQQMVDGRVAWGPGDGTLWDRYQCLRRAAARDMGISVDQTLLGWETSVRGQGTAAPAGRDERRGCASR